MTLEPLIRRVDHNYFHGWAVAIKRAGRRLSRYFSDRPDGSAAALRKARAYKKRMTARLPPPVKIKRTFVLNKTGVIGVALVREKSRAGTPTDRFVVSVPLARGRRGKVSFSLAKYGPAEAFSRAVEARRRAVADYVRQRKRQAT